MLLREKGAFWGQKGGRNLSIRPRTTEPKQKALKMFADFGCIYAKKKGRRRGKGSRRVHPSKYSLRNKGGRSRPGSTMVGDFFVLESLEKRTNIPVRPGYCVHDRCARGGSHPPRRRSMIAAKAQILDLGKSGNSGKKLFKWTNKCSMSCQEGQYEKGAFGERGPSFQKGR